MALGSSRNDCHICQNHVIGGAWPWLCRHELQENAAQAALLAGLGVLAGRTLADAECGDTEPPKAGACPAGYKYIAKKKGCAKVSCGTGSVWSGEQHACIDGHSAALTDQDFYTEAVALADEGHFREALDLLTRIKKQEQSRVLNMVGYTTRKLGDVDRGLDYYQRALALDPNYLRAREYLGEGYRAMSPRQRSNSRRSPSVAPGLARNTVSSSRRS